MKINDNELVLASAVHFWLKKIKCSDLTTFELKLFKADLDLANEILKK